MINMDMKVNVDLQPVLNATPKAIDRIFRLIFPKYTMRTERLIQLSQAQNTQDVKKIMQGDAYFDTEDELLIEKYGSYNPIDFVKNIIADEEAINLLKCSMHASNYINDESPTEEKIDSTFINRWRNEAMSFSEENLQEMWGQILAEKINKASSISLRALDILKNISKQEASIFEAYCENIIFNDRIFEHYPSKNGLDTLAEIGIILRTQGMSSGGGWPIQKTSNGENIYYIVRNQDFFWIPVKELKSDSPLILLENNLLTSTGKVLYNITSKNQRYNKIDFGQLLIKNSGVLPYINCSLIEENGSIDLSNPLRITK